MTDGSGDLDARTSQSLRAILDLEDEAPDVLLEVVPGATIPLWSQVRVRVSWALSAQETGSVEAAAGSWNRWREAKRLARSLMPSRWDAVRRAALHDVCFYVAGGTLAAEGERVRNWLVDDFAGAIQDAIVVQQQPLPSALGKPVFSPTLSMDAANARLSLRARGQAPPSAAVDAIRRLTAEFARRLGQPADAFAKITQRAVRDATLRPFQHDELQRLIDRVHPQIVIFDNGSYTYHGEAVAQFKDAGAYVAEPQHGWIGPSHPAYNYGRIFQEPLMRRALPDELLTFGTYWSESVRHPGRITAIGKPHIERQIAQAPPRRSKQILVVSSRTDHARTDAFVVGLRAAVGDGWSIVFRPHPGERSETEIRYPRLAAHPRVGVDTAPDVYESLKQSAVVIGEASTVLFEARAFGCVVIARDSAFAGNVIGDAFGDRVADVEQAAARIDAIQGEDAVVASPDPRFWAPAPSEAFARWVDERRRERGSA